MVTRLPVDVHDFHAWVQTLHDTQPLLHRRFAWRFTLSIGGEKAHVSMALWAKAQNVLEAGNLQASSEFYPWE